MSGSDPTAVCVPVQLMFPDTLGSGFYDYPYFTEKKTEVQRDDSKYSGSQN